MGTARSSLTRGSCAAGMLAWAGIAAAFISVGASADDWPIYRGPHHDGHSAETGWTDQWGAQGPRIAWKANVGLGHSSVVVGDGRMFTAGHADEHDTVYCFNAETGEEIWTHRYPADIGARFYEGGTTGTPTIEGERVYWLSKWGDLFAFEAATGKVLWNTQVQKDTGIRVPDWGFTGAPYVHGELLVLTMGEAGVAVDKNSGKVVWKSANKDSGYSTPVPVAVGGREFLVLGSREHYIAIDPASGEEAWRIRWLTQYGVNAADPIHADGKLFVSSGYGKGAGLFDVTQRPPKQLWTSKVLGTQLNPGVLHDGHVYGMDGDTDKRGPLKCVEFATGREKWAVPGFGTGGLTIADGKLIVLSSFGELSVAPATPEGFRPVARAQVLGGKCWTAPVLANGRIYCRNSRGDLVCVDVRGQDSSL